MRLLGIALVAAASLSVGFSYCAEEKERVKTLGELCLALDMLRGELAVRQSPLPELIRLLSTRTRGQVKQFFDELKQSLDRLGERDFSQLWDDSATSLRGVLSEEDMTSFVSLGTCLGRYELEQQLSQLDLCRAALYSNLERRRAALPEKRKLGMGLACAAGALLVIILI